METSCEAGKVNISGTTCELVKDKLTSTHRGKIKAKENRTCILLMEGFEKSASDNKV